MTISYTHIESSLKSIIKRPFTIVTGLMFVSIGLFGQTPYPGCPNVSQTPDDPTLALSNDTLYLHCNQTCADLEATFLSTGLTDTYKVESIPYAPPFPSTGGTPLLIGLDDRFGDILDIPFDFCFYGTSYNQLVVGANGMITFDLSKDAASNCYVIDNPIPNATNANNCVGLTAAGNGNMLWNSIYGPFLDLDPSVNNPKPNINYTILGSAPCRTFVLNFTDVAQFSCNNLRSTQQIVLYETTSVIEIYINKREVCTGWNDGKAVIGIQNANGTKATTPPGRNTGAWTANNEGWRFTPDGAPNYTLKWYDEHDNVISTNANVQVCVPDPTVSSKYKVEVEYTICDGSKILVEDYINLVAREELTADFETKSSRCFEECDGSAKINVLTGDGPFTYTWPNGVVNNTNFVDTLCKGNYNIKVQDIYGCEETFNFSVDEPSELKSTSDMTVVSCNGLKDGTGEVDITGGTPPYSVNWSNTDVGTLMIDGAGMYYATITDDSLCVHVDSVLITEPEVLLFDTNITPLTCPAEQDGVIEFLPTGGNPPYQYSIDDGTTYSGSPIFNNLASNTYQLRVKDDKDCEYAFDVFVPQGIISLQGPNDTTICEGSDVSFTATGEYSTLSWDGGIENGVNFTPDFVGTRTYTVTVQNEGGCELEDKVNLTVEPVYDPTITSAGPFCTIAADFQLEAEDPNGTWSGTGVDANGLFSPGAAGQGTHTITYSFGGFCPRTHSINIGVNNSFDAAIDPVGDVCELDAPFKLTGVTPGGLWYGPGIVDVTDSLKSDFDPAMAGPGTHKIYHFIDGDCGELDSTEITVIQAERAQIDAIPEFCPTGNIATLTATPAGGTWSGTGIDAAGNFDPNISGSGTFPVTYTPASACRVTDTKNVTVVSQITATGDTDHLDCYGDSDGYLKVTANGGKLPYTYTWTGGSASITDEATNLIVGAYTTTITDDLGCSVTVNSTVTEPTQLVINSPAVVVDASCGGYSDGSVVFDPKGGTQMSYYGHSLFPNAGTFNGSDGFDNLPAGNYTVTITDSKGCPVTESFIVDQPTPIYLTASHVDEYCGLSDGSITVSSVSGGVSASGNYTYSWAHGPTTKDLSNLANGSYTLTITDDNSCTKDTTITLLNGGGPTLNLDHIPTTCFGGSDGKAFVSSITGGSGTSYTYNWNTGSVTDTAFNASIGTYTVTVTDNNNCSVTGNVTVTQPTEVTIAPVRDSIMCDGQTFITTLSAANGNGFPYTFTADAGTISGDDFSIGTPGTYTVFATDYKGCISQNTSFDVSYLAPLSVSVNPINPACPGDVVTLTAVGSGGNGNYTFDWNSGAFSGQSISYTTRTDGAAETITVTMDDGCSTPTSTTYTITFNNIPLLQPTFNPNEGCEPLTVSFGLNQDNYSSILWYLGDGNTMSNTYGFDHTYTIPGNYTVSIDAVTAEGCNLSDTWVDTIKVNPLPYGEISQNPSRITVINNIGNYNVQGNGTIANIEWTVSFGDSVIFRDTILRLEVEYPELPGIYTIDAHLITDKGCTADISYMTEVFTEQKIYVPTAFTPNGDGVNEFFQISTFNVPISEFEIQIFDRWGEMIFESDQLDFKWDGTYRNILSHTGQYVWKIRYNDGIPKKVELTGRVNLLR
tara:strand:+ start:104689 stop:109551 length:4863 start_codon:yes stop_codon:yes gene_type:complete